jgi:hypothetical protein
MAQAIVKTIMYFISNLVTKSVLPEIQALMPLSWLKGSVRRDANQIGVFGNNHRKGFVAWCKKSSSKLDGPLDTPSHPVRWVNDDGVPVG